MNALGMSKKKRTSSRNSQSSVSDSALWRNVSRSLSKHLSARKSRQEYRNVHVKGKRKESGIHRLYEFRKEKERAELDAKKHWEKAQLIYPIKEFCFSISELPWADSENNWELAERHFGKRERSATSKRI